MIAFMKVSGKFSLKKEIISYRNNFIFEDEYYEGWSKWSNCTLHCKMYRERLCRKSYLKIKDNFTCQVKIIREIKLCSKHSNCSANTTIILSQKTLKSLPQNCGWKPKSREIKRKIHGGLAAREGSWPWNLALQLNRPSRHSQICSATLISPEWAITAAHCVRFNMINEESTGKLIRLPYHSASVIVNNYRRNVYDRDEFHVFISHVILHHSYRDGATYTDYDFALLKLERPLLHVPSYSFACISEDENLDLERHSNCYSIGWGQQNTDKDIYHKNYDKRLQEVKLPLISFEYCKLYYEDIYINYTIHVCAGENKKDTCVGDSGAGLFCKHPSTKRWMLYGIVSFGADVDCGESIGVFARISGALKWIKDTLKITYFP